MKNFYLQEWTKSERILVTATAFLLGLVIGFLFAPSKKGIYCGNNNGNSTLLPSDLEQETKKD